MIESLLIWNLEWLDIAGFSDAQGEWLYALLAALKVPLLPEQYSTLREIVFKCAKIRAALVWVHRFFLFLKISK